MEIELSHCLGEGKGKKFWGCACRFASVLAGRRPAGAREKMFCVFLFLFCFVLCVCGINLSIFAENNKEIIYYFFVL